MKERLPTHNLRLSAGLLAATLALAGCGSNNANKKPGAAVGPQGVVLECTNAKILDGIVSVKVDRIDAPGKAVFIDEIRLQTIDEHGHSRAAHHAARSNTADFSAETSAYYSQASISITKHGYAGAVACPTIVSR